LKPNLSASPLADIASQYAVRLSLAVIPRPPSQQTFWLVVIWIGFVQIGPVIDTNLWC